MTRWLCRVLPEELAALPEQTEDALTLGIQGWLLPVQQNTVSDLLRLLSDWPASMQLCLELLELECPLDLLDQALFHPSRATFQGRPMLLVRPDGEFPVAVLDHLGLHQVAVFGPCAKKEFCGLAGWIPPADSNGLLNYAWFLKRAHFRGAHPDLLLPAVRALDLDQMDAFVAADAEMYQAWLQLESAWSALQVNGEEDATVLIDSWGGHQRWWGPEQTSSTTTCQPQNPRERSESERQWGVMHPSHLAIAIHGFYLDRMASILQQLPPGGDQEGWPPLDLYVSTPSHQLATAAECIRRLNWPRVRVFGVPNRGRDFAPFVLHLLPAILEVGHGCVLKLHTKASTHMNFGGAWAYHMESSLLSPALFEHFQESDELGVVTPQGTLLPMSLNLADNVAWMQHLAALNSVPTSSLLGCHFPAGSMFFAKTDALLPLLNFDLSLDDFEPEAGQVDGTLAHALERWTGVAVESRGYHQAQAPGDASLVPDFGFRHALRTVPKIQAPAKAVPLYQEPGDFEPFQIQAQELCEQGFTVVDLGHDRIAALAERIKTDLGESFDLVAWRAQGGEGDLRLQDAWRNSSAVRELALLPELQQLLRCCWGREPFAFQTLNFPVGTQQHIHSDAVHFHTEPPGFMCGIWVALEPIHPHAGPLEYLPGSHRLPYLQCRDVGVLQQPGVTPDQRIFHNRWTEAEHRYGLERQQFTPQLGQALIWSANLIHGGSAVIDPARTRWSQVTHYFFEGCCYYTPLLSDWPDGDVAWRQPLNIARDNSPAEVDR